MTRLLARRGGVSFELIEANSKAAVKVTKDGLTEYLVLEPSLNLFTFPRDWAHVSTLVYHLPVDEAADYEQDLNDGRTAVITDYGHPVANLLHFRDDKDKNND